MTTPESGLRSASQELVEELMGAVVAVDFVLCTLMGLPEDALSGENRAEAIREFLSASACSELEAVGEETCRATTALLAAVIERIAEDADAAARLAGVDGHRLC